MKKTEAQREPDVAGCTICGEPITKGQPMLYAGMGTARGAVHIRCLAKVAMEDGLVIRIDRRATVKTGGAA